VTGVLPEKNTFRISELWRWGKWKMGNVVSAMLNGGAGYVPEAFNTIPIRNVHPDSIIALCGKRILNFRLGQDKAGRIRLLGPFGFNVQ